MNAHQRRLARRECFRTMLPGTEVRTIGGRNLRGPHPVVVEVRTGANGVPAVLLEQRFDLGRQAMRGVIPFTSIIAYRRPA